MLVIQEKVIGKESGAVFLTTSAGIPNKVGMFSSDDQVKTNQRNLNFRLDNTHRGSQRDIKSPDFAVKTQKSPCVHSILLI